MAFLKRFWWVLPVAVYAVLWVLHWHSIRDNPDISMGHAVYRTFLHVMAGPGVFLGLLWVQWVTDRKSWWFDLRGYAGYAAPCFVAAGMIFFREAIDAANSPDAVYKSYLDYVSWLIGTGWGAYFTYRVTPYAHKLNGQIASARVGRHERSRSRSR